MPDIPRHYGGVPTFDPGLEMPAGCGGVGTCPTEINYTQSPNCIPLSYEFTGSIILEPGDSVISWSWDFGDGTTGEGQVISHAFPADTAATYTVGLTVATSSGCSNLEEININVPSEGCSYRLNGSADVNIANLSPLARGVVSNVDDTSTGGNPYRCDTISDDAGLIYESCEYGTAPFSGVRYYGYRSGELVDLEGSYEVVTGETSGAVAAPDYRRNTINLSGCVTVPSNGVFTDNRVRVNVEDLSPGGNAWCVSALQSPVRVAVTLDHEDINQSRIGCQWEDMISIPAGLSIFDIGTIELPPVNATIANAGATQSNFRLYPRVPNAPDGSSFAACAEFALDQLPIDNPTCTINFNPPDPCP